MILRDLLVQATRQLRAGGIETPERDARLLVADVLGTEASRLVLEPDLDISQAQSNTLDGFLARRLAHEPVSRILGKRAFWGRDFEITPDVLDPRPETETLVDLARQSPAPKQILDLGCGSGILGVTLLAEFSGAEALCTDISPACLEVATANAERIGVSDRFRSLQSDWFHSVKGQFDLIVSNPPYITDQEMAELSQDVFDYDPHLALTPGGDGLAPYVALAKGAKTHLTPGGRILVETGWRQGTAVMEIFRDAGLGYIQSHKDMNGHVRVVSAHHS